MWSKIFLCNGIDFFLWPRYIRKMHAHRPIVAHSLLYNVPDRYKKPEQFYKYAFDPLTPTFALWILQRNLDLADADYSISGNCR
jgi:hypothetical protein